MKAYHTRINQDAQIALSQEVLNVIRIEAGDFVDVHIDDEGVHIRRHQWTLETVMGSQKTPPHLHGMNTEEIIRKARQDYAEKVEEFMNLGRKVDE